MPKVTDEYLASKKNFILKCTDEILKEKALYQITMKDIIKKAGFSQGTIYRYYPNIDEIYVDLINQNTTYSSLEQNIDHLINSKQAEKIILFDCIIAIGEYIEDLLQSVGGKTCFELFVFFGADYEKRNLVLPKLKLKQSLDYAQNATIDFFMLNVEKGILQPTISVDLIVKFISVSVDGIIQAVAMSKIGKNSQDEKLTIDASEMFQTLGKAMINFLAE